MSHGIQPARISRYDKEADKGEQQGIIKPFKKSSVHKKYSEYLNCRHYLTRYYPRCHQKADQKEKEEKKGSMTKIAPKIFPLLLKDNILDAIALKAPHFSMPATTAMRENKRDKTLKSI